MVHSGDDIRASSSRQLTGTFCSAIGGDQTSIDQLLEAYRPLLLKLANEQLDPELRQKAAASDLVQNSLMKAMLGFERASFNEIQDVVAWLRQILTNEIASAHRRYRQVKKRDSRRERRIDSVASRMWMDDLAIKTRMDESITMSRQEEIERVRMAVADLPGHYRQVIVWHAVEGRTFAEIGIQLERTEDATRMLWKRALERLKKDLHRKWKS